MQGVFFFSQNVTSMLAIISYINLFEVSKTRKGVRDCHAQTTVAQENNM